jgi:DNA-binding HxlR family transcriptional regulator
VGERWTLLVARELLLGPKRFTDLRAGLPGVSADVLADRLRGLEQAGLVQRDTLPPPAASRIYELTQRGRELEPVLVELGRFGRGAPMPQGGAVFGPDAFAVALKSLFDPEAAAGLWDVFELRIAGQSFAAEVADGGLDLAHGRPQDPDAVIAGEPASLADVLWHGGELDAAVRSGTVSIGGDGDAARRFFGLFAGR